MSEQGVALSRKSVESLVAIADLQVTCGSTPLMWGCLRDSLLVDLARAAQAAPAEPSGGPDPEEARLRRVAAVASVNAQREEFEARKTVDEEEPAGGAEAPVAEKSNPEGGDPNASPEPRLDATSGAGVATPVPENLCGECNHGDGKGLCADRLAHLCYRGVVPTGWKDRRTDLWCPRPAPPADVHEGECPLATQMEEYGLSLHHNYPPDKGRIDHWAKEVRALAADRARLERECAEWRADRVGLVVERDALGKAVCEAAVIHREIHEALGVPEGESIIATARKLRERAEQAEAQKVGMAAGLAEANRLRREAEVRAQAAEKVARGSFPVPDDPAFQDLKRVDRALRFTADFIATHYDEIGARDFPPPHRLCRLLADAIARGPEGEGVWVTRERAQKSEAALAACRLKSSRRKRAIQDLQRNAMHWQGEYASLYGFAEGGLNTGKVLADNETGGWTWLTPDATAYRDALAGAEARLAAIGDLVGLPAEADLTVAVKELQTRAAAENRAACPACGGRGVRKHQQIEWAFEATVPCTECVPGAQKVINVMRDLVNEMRKAQREKKEAEKRVEGEGVWVPVAPEQRERLLRDLPEAASYLEHITRPDGADFLRLLRERLAPAEAGEGSKE